MRKTKWLFTLVLAGSIFLAGCGKVDVSPERDRNTAASDNVENTGNNSDSSDNGSESPETVSPDREDTPSETVPREPETPSPTTGAVTPKQGYSDPEREVSIVGIKEYKTLKTDKYTDKAKKNKKFLVLFLKVRNRTNEKIYFNVNYLSAKVDGKEIENTFLVNDPEGYPTVFSNIVPDSYYGGFIVWEVPENWKKMEVAYEGWRDSDGLTLNSKFTQKDLFEPEEYSKTTYDQSSGQ